MPDDRREEHLQITDPESYSLTKDELRELKGLLQMWRFGRWVVYIVLGAGSLAVILNNGWHALLSHAK